MIKKKYQPPIFKTNVLLLECSIAANSATISPGEHDGSPNVRETWTEKTDDFEYEW